jgi:RHS repeat-associated protein
VIAENSLYLLTDGHGSTRVVNWHGPTMDLVVGVYRYDAYGTLEVSGGGEHLVRHLYSGQAYDINTKLQPLGNGTRYYQASSGTFLSLDPFAGNSSDPLSLHKYLYAHANPVMYSDPTGMFTMPQLIVTTGISMTLVGASMTTYGHYTDNVFVRDVGVSLMAYGSLLIGGGALLGGFGGAVALSASQTIATSMAMVGAGTMLSLISAMAAGKIRALGDEWAVQDYMGYVMTHSTPAGIPREAWIIYRGETVKRSTYFSPVTGSDVEYYVGDTILTYRIATDDSRYALSVYEVRENGLSLRRADTYTLSHPIIVVEDGKSPWVVVETGK